MSNTFGWNYQVNAGQAIGVIGNLQGAVVNLNQTIQISQANINQMGGSAKNAASHFDVLGKAMGSFVSTASALGLISKAFTEMGDAIKQAREHGEQTGKRSFAQRDKARELANLMNEPEPNDRVMARVFRTSMASGLNFDETVKFLEQFYGSIPAGIKKGHVREDQLPELAEAGAKAAVRMGLDAATGGDLAGVIAQHVDLNNVARDPSKDINAPGNRMTAVEALIGQMEGMYFGSQEGRGKASVLMRNELAQAAHAMASGHISSLAEMGAFVGTASTISKTGAFSGTLFSQLDRALNRQDKFGDFLKEIGVADQKGDRAKLLALKKHIDEVKPDDVAAYLYEKGLHAQQDIRATIGFMENTDVLEKTRLKAEEKARHPEEAFRKQREFEQGIDYQNRKAEARVGAAEFETGDRHAAIMIARKNAMARLEHQGLLHDEDQVAAEKLKHVMNVESWTGAPDALKRMIDEEVARDIEQKIPDARKRGITGDFRYGFAVHHGLGATDTEQVERFNQAMDLAPEILGGNEDAGIGATFRAADRRDAKGNLIPARNTPWRDNPALAGKPLPRLMRGLEPPAAEAPAAGPPGGGLGPGGGPGPQAALDVHDLKQAADALKQAAALQVAAAAANRDTYPGFEDGGYTPYRA